MHACNWYTTKLKMLNCINRTRLRVGLIELKNKPESNKNLELFVKAAQGCSCVNSYAEIASI